MPQPAAPEPILSPQTAEASRAPLENLSRMVVKPEVAGADTLEGLVREMLRPMLSDWLDANLPELVETMVAKEIARITGQRPEPRQDRRSGRATDSVARATHLLLYLAP